MATTLYANGRIPLTALDPIDAANGQTAYLLPPAAASFKRVQAKCQQRLGFTLRATSAGDGFRSEDRQITVFLQRYRTQISVVWQGGRFITDRRMWKGVYYWRFTGAAAAVPSTSNHGWGTTVDHTPAPGFTSEQYDILDDIWTEEGWSDDEGRSVSEPWHKVYIRTAYPVSNTNTLPGVTITPVDVGDLPAALRRRAAEDDTMIVIESPGALWTLQGDKLAGLGTTAQADRLTGEGVPRVMYDAEEFARLRAAIAGRELIRNDSRGFAVGSPGGRYVGLSDIAEVRFHEQAGCATRLVSEQTFDNLTR